MSWYGPLWVDPVWDSLCFLGLDVFFLSQVREIISYYIFKYVLCPFLSLFSFWDPYKVNVNVFDVVPEVSYTVLISFFFSPFVFFSVLLQ